MVGFIDNIEEKTEQNNFFRQVLLPASTPSLSLLPKKAKGKR
jgi:hypothetical protein